MAREGPNYARNDLAHHWNLITNESPTTSGVPMAGEGPNYTRNDLAHIFEFDNKLESYYKWSTHG
jgi:hypothetical protein